ncbi:MAG: hypothetical protein AAF321_11085 [Pseudomonadota bacterium]
MWRILGGWERSGWHEDRHGGWRESVWHRSMRRAGAGVVLLGLALLVRGTLGILSADADERVLLPDGSVIGVPDQTDWRDLPDIGEDGTIWQERIATGQPLPRSRPPGLFLRTLQPEAEVRHGKAARRSVERSCV